MEKLAAQMHKLVGKLRYHKEATNVLVRFFTGLFYNFRRNKLRKLSYDLQDMRLEEQSIASAYREHYAVYLSRLDYLKNHPFAELEKARAWALHAVEQVGEKPTRDEAKDIWDLFARSRQMPVGDISRLAALKNQLQADIGRARTLRSCLEDWQKDMQRTA
jgi:hypothetical protein